jgi:hypothetical protein
MARKTKAEQQAELDALNAAAMLADAEAYPAKLMAALEEATTKNNYELTVRNGMFNLRDRDSSRDSTLSLSMAYTGNSFDALENLEWDLQEKAAERAESERLSAVRRAAFAKLSEEEKTALGLTDRNNW